jgi:uncharacterized protein involved in exopolysaccharide biosynthesis
MSEQQVLQNSKQQAQTGNDEPIRLMDVLTVFGRQKKLVLGMPVLCGGVALAISLLMTPMFTSTVTIMPPEQQQSSMSAMLGQLGGLASLAGVGGIKSPSDLYVGLLESRTVADSLINRFKLQERYQKKTVEETRRELASIRSINNGKKDGTISVTASDKDPKFAADLANAYVDELMKLSQILNLTQASQRRAFLEKQLNEAKDSLANAEVALRRTQERTGMLQPDAQVKAIISNAAQLKGTIAAKEVELKSMRSFATSSNPEFVRAQEELRGLQTELGKLEKSQPKGDGDFMVPTARIPGVSVEYVRNARDVKYYETMFELLAKQFEMAKIDEARDSSTIQVLDKAIPAERKSKPQRLLITAAGFITGALLGIWIAFIRDSLQRSRRNPANASRWQQLDAAWRTKR